MDIIIDSKIRDWVFLPLIFVMFMVIHNLIKRLEYLDIILTNTIHSIQFQLKPNPKKLLMTQMISMQKH
jgi:hypothetical protein